MCTPEPDGSAPRRGHGGAPRPSLRVSESSPALAEIVFISPLSFETESLAFFSSVFQLLLLFFQ